MALVKTWLKTNPGKSRQALARSVCEALDLKDALGALRIGGTVKALRGMEARGYWRLPKAQNANGKGTCGRPRRLGRAVALPRAVPGRVEQVQGLRLVEVTPISAASPDADPVEEDSTAEVCDDRLAA